MLGFVNFQKKFWRYWYNKLSNDPLRAAHWTLLNYGYRDTDANRDAEFWQQWQQFDLSGTDPATFDLARLYLEVCTSGPQKTFANMNVLEIGSGRGGGAAFIAKNMRPASYIGADLAKNAIAFCQKTHHSVHNLKFQQDDAENLSFENDSFDIAINIESSHCYPNFNMFISQVHRVLKPGGLFYFSDFRSRPSADAVKETLLKEGFSIVHSRDITENVLTSLNHTDSAKKSQIQKSIPKLLQRVFYIFAGSKNTYMYRRFASGQAVYFLYVLRKDE